MFTHSVQATLFVNSTKKGGSSSAPWGSPGAPGSPRGDAMIVENYDIPLVATETNKYVYSGAVLRSTEGSTTTFLPHGKGCLQLMQHLVSDQQGTEDTASPEASAEAAVTFEGEFVCGKRHGRGTIIVSSLDVQLACLWENDLPQLHAAPCRLERAGDIFIGMVSLVSNGAAISRDQFAGLAWARLVRFLPDATGEMLYKNRQRYCGEWQCGQRHGFGVETDLLGSYIYIGGFSDDMRNGVGTLFNASNKTVISGFWKDSDLSGGASIHLPHRLHTIHTSGLTPDSTCFTEGSMYRRRPINGVWEPLFVNVDNNLAVCAAELLSSPALSTSPPSDEANEATVFDLVHRFLDRPELQGAFATFQRCMYFLYGTCGCSIEYGGGAMDQSIAESRTRSWCLLAGMGDLCPHRQRGRELTEETLQRAVADTSSFIFSVRLRLLSIVAAHPEACDFNANRKILALVWNKTFSTIGALLEELMFVVDRAGTAALKLAAARCRNLHAGDFVDLDGVAQVLDDQIRAIVDALKHHTMNSMTMTPAGPLLTHVPTMVTTLQDRFATVQTLFHRLSTLAGMSLSVNVNDDTQHADAAQRFAYCMLYVLLGAARQESKLQPLLRLQLELMTISDPHLPALLDCATMISRLGTGHPQHDDSDGAPIADDARKQEQRAEHSLRYMLTCCKWAASTFPSLRGAMGSNDCRTVWPLLLLLQECRQLLLVHVPQCDPPAATSRGRRGIFDVEKVAACHTILTSTGLHGISFGRSFDSAQPSGAETSTVASPSEVDELDEEVVWTLDCCADFLQQLTIRQLDSQATSFDGYERAFASRTLRRSAASDPHRRGAQIELINRFLHRLEIHMDTLFPTHQPVESTHASEIGMAGTPGRQRKRSDYEVDFSSPSPSDSDVSKILLRTKPRFSLPPLAIREVSSQWRYATNTLKHQCSTKAIGATLRSAGHGSPGAQR